MNLLLLFDHESGEHHTNCFISLPTPIAASLWELKPRASLIILSVLPKGGNESNYERFVAWTGGTISYPDTLGIHPVFASSLGLRDSQFVQALVVNRVIGNDPSVSVVSATLRPVSYARTEEGSNHIAREHYHFLSETADILERTILPQIRVIYEGLTFPITLPAKESILVQVTNLTLSETTGTYGILVPGTELLIEPPPEYKQYAMLNQVFRALSFSEPLQGIPQNLLTHAILPKSFSTNVNIRAAQISKRLVEDGDRILPISFFCHANIPQNHVWLPSFIWHDLKLAPLEPVIIQEVPMFSNVSDAVRITPTKVIRPDFPSIENVREEHAIIYNGMQLRNGTLCIGASEAVTRPLPSNAEETSSEQNTASEVMANWEGTDKLRNQLDDACRRLRTKVKVIPGWAVDEHQYVSFREDEENFVVSLNENGEDMSIFNPMADDILRAGLAESLTRASRTVVHDAINWTSCVLSGHEGSNNAVSAILLISGPEGTGKTIVCKTIAAILRSVALLRTVWIQGSGKKESVAGMVRQLQCAYSAATDSGPGVVILDDIDFWIGARRLENMDPSEHGEKGRGKDQQGYELLRRMRMTRNHHALSIMTCRNAIELDESFRAPGAISRRLTLDLPEREDMPILRWVASQETNNLTEFDTGMSRSDSESAWERVTASLEGYNAKEIKLLFLRAFNRIDPESPIPQDQQVEQHLENMMSELAPGEMKKGSRLRKTEATWAWKQIGGAETAKKALTEVLLRPSRRHELFKSAPLSLPRGVLLYGPPGCGKTMLAKAAAHESKMRCIFVKGPELMSKYIGESEAEVRRVFARASRLRPCVLLFDEFDSLAPRRGSGTGVTDRIVNTLLTCMDGAERLSEGVYMLATSSRPELIDPAVLRPGRIDRWVPVEVPASTDERLDILKRLSEDFFNSSELLNDALENIAHVTEDYTGADLGAILNDARFRLRKVGRKKKLSENEVVEAIGEALRESRPSMSSSERARFRHVMLSFRRAPGKGGKQMPSTQRVALK